ncbi:unnamed protein product [Lactuca saligna]|uniref:Uncharacterized protein n=1 Tax=Lactuca saligna TaxID=75948 RepID=A0AA35YTF8_LACSI|nr:unnamed protein product [Lactuca saligna]
MQKIVIPSTEGLIVDDEPNDMSIFLYSKASTKTFNIDLDDYSPSPQKESQENDKNQDEKFSTFQLDPPQEDDAQAHKEEETMSELVPKHIRLIAQMIADGIEEIPFHTSSHSKYLDKSQWYLERMVDNVCILNKTSEVLVKKLLVTIVDFHDTNLYIKGQTIRNMRKIERLDP